VANARITQTSQITTQEKMKTPKKFKVGKTLVQVFAEESEKPGTESWFDMVNERYGDLLKMDGYDDCIIGVTTQFNKTTILYDKDKVIAKLTKEFLESGKKEQPGILIGKKGIFVSNAKDQEQAEQDAHEWFDFNMIGAWVGDTTPSFFTKS
jgi:hypothetical protein